MTAPVPRVAGGGSANGRVIDVRAAPEELTPADLARLAALLADRSGLACPESRWPFLHQRVGELVARRGFVSPRRWLGELEASAAKRGSLYRELEEALSVHETSFFRYAPHHRVLGDVVLPALVRAGGPRARILSVGCATGEEPYSIAMTVRESVPLPAVEVLALDMSRAALGAAVRGIFSAAQAAAVPAAWLARYFGSAPDGFAVGPALRELVRFRHHDIRRGFYLDKFDVVFACNVLVYFTPAMRRQVLARLIESLSPGGYLFLGHAEGITPPTALFDARVAPDAFVYRRNHTRAAAGEPGLGCDAEESAFEASGAPALAGRDGHGG